MKRKHKSLLIGLAIASVAVCAHRCSAQQKQTTDGSVSFHKEWIYIKQDSVITLQILQVDTLKNLVVYKVISSDGLGFVTVDQYAITYHYKINEGRRARVKRFMFLK